MTSKYTYYNVDQFLVDDDFINWILNPTPETNTFWNTWIEENPQKKETVLNARLFIENINIAEEQFSTIEDKDENELWASINSSLNKQNHKFSTFNKYKVHLYAASVIMLLFFSIITLKHSAKDLLNENGTYTSWILDENNTGSKKRISLADGSTVILEPYSLLRYPNTFGKKQRDVILKGEAFFDIKRDTAKPFLIYANETITKVLGTSFTIKAFEGDEDVEVTVKTGKVAVYASVASEKNNSKTKRMVISSEDNITVPLPNRKLEILPNQKVIFNKSNKALTKTIASKPKVINTFESDLNKIHFKDTPVEKVFDELMFAYGIEIKFDEKNLSNCTITTTLSDMPLLEKIDMICHALLLEFKEEEGIIYINGKGCN